MAIEEGTTEWADIVYGAKTFGRKILATAGARSGWYKSWNSKIGVTLHHQGTR